MVLLPVFVFVSLHHNLHSLHTIIMIMIMCLIFSLVLQCEQDLKPRSHADSTVRGDIKEAIKTRSCFVPSNILQINPFVFMLLPLKKCQILLIFEPSQKTSIPLFLVCNLSYENSDGNVQIKSLQCCIELNVNFPFFSMCCIFQRGVVYDYPIKLIYWSRLISFLSCILYFCHI